MRTAHEKLHDAEFMTDDEKSIRRVEEAGIIRSPLQSRKLANERLRVAICELTDANIENVQTWLDKVSTEDPAKAIDFLLRMLEFSVPKLSRVESQVSVNPGSGNLGDLTVRDLQAMVQAHQKEERTIEGECEPADDFSELI